MTSTDTPSLAGSSSDATRLNRQHSGAGGRTHLATVVAVVAFLAAVALVLTLASAPVDARFPIDNISNVDDTATVTPSGANVAVSGWTRCTEGEIAEISITVSQDDTVATGKTHVRCAGLDERQSWTIHVSPRGPAIFDAAETVQVDARAVPRARGQPTATPHTWTNDAVTLTAR